MGSIHSMALLIGFLVGTAMILAIRNNGRATLIFNVSLLALPLPYMIFAIYEQSKQALLAEVLWGTPYFLAPLLLLCKDRTTLKAMAALYTLHAFYDIWHDSLFINAGTPDWYPAFCAIFDLVIGGYLLYAAANQPEYTGV